MGFKTSLQTLARENQSRRALFLLALNLVVCMIMVWCVMTSNSLALHTFAFLTFFDILSIMTSLLSSWISHQKPTSTFSFGFERFEVLAIFASTMVILLSGVSIMKQGLERILSPPVVETPRMLFALLVGLATHLQVTYGLENKAYRHVATAAGASWLQDAVADLGHSVCSAVPLLRRSLIPQFNPLALVSLAASLAVFTSCLAIDNFGAMTADAIAAMCIVMLVSGTMLPLAIYTGRILLQTTPEHVVVQLDKCLREVATLDGVLEVRKEHFWMLSFGTMAGSLHVRIRRDANEQEVLAQVITRLSAVVSHLTVQTFKEDWSVPASSVSRTSSAVPQPPPASRSTSLQSHVVEFGRQNSGPTASFPPLSHSGPTASFPTVSPPIRALYGDPAQAYLPMNSARPASNVPPPALAQEHTSSPYSSTHGHPT